MADLSAWLRSRWPRPGAVPPLLADALLAAAVLVAGLLVVALGSGRTRADLAMYAWSALSPVPLVLRRTAPRSAVLLTLAIGIGELIAERYPPSFDLTFIVITYTLAAYRPLRPAVAALLVLWLPVFAVNVFDSDMAGATGLSVPLLLVNNALIALVSFLVGRAVYARRASTRALEERARSAEINQRALAEQAVADERRRIARELHDVVAHHVSVMGVLATGARRVLARDPRAADEALGTIEDTSRTAMREMRRLLDVLRTDTEPSADLAPQPGLTGIESLVEQVRDAGLPVTLRVDGVPGDLDPGVALTVYRIVQEALTNALKHAGMATAEVRLRFGVYWLTVEVFDTGRGPRPDHNRLGHGLVGMRERVALYGGTLRTGPRAGGGFRVYAKIPVEQLGSITEVR